MKEAHIAIATIVMLAVSCAGHAQTIGALIANPKLSDFGYLPLTGGDIVLVDTLTAPRPRSTRIDSFPWIDKSSPPAGILVTGMVPDPYCGWAVAVTHDREEFERALPEYRRLIAEGKWNEANEVLHVSTGIDVSTKVEQFRDREKIGELPEKVGTFFFSIGTSEIEKHGGCLTFLSFTRDPDYPMIGIGKGIGETIHGIVQVVKTEGKHGYEFSYGMEIILADVTEEE